MTINDVKTLLTGKVTAGKYKLSVFVNDKNRTQTNALMLYYNNDNDFVSQAGIRKAPYYKTGVQVTVRHDDYDASREGIFNALEYINAHRKDSTGYYLTVDTTPVYLGVDGDNGGYVWGFDIAMKGAK